jgi:hypothetical protein
MEIDFDEASYEWRRNKISIGNGSFAYCCGQLTDNGICKNRLKSSAWCLCDDHKEIYCLHDDCLESDESFRSYYDLNLHMLRYHTKI